MNKINSPRKSKFTLDGRLCRPNFAWLGLMLLFLALFPLSSHAQRISKQEQLQALCEPMENIEFFHFKNELNITREKFLSTYLELLDLAPQSEMRFVRTHTNDIGVTSTFYQQYLNGYKIKGAEMVINERNGMVQYVNGRYLQQSPTQSTANISAETALQTAFAQVESKDYLWKYPEAEEAYRRFKKDPTASYLPKGELMYVAASPELKELKDFKLVWQYEIHVNPQTQSKEIFVDAISGEVLYTLPLTYECSGGTSTTLWNGAQTIYTQLNAGTYRTLGDCNTAQIHTYNGNGNDNGVGATYYTDADNAWPNTNLGKYIAQTHWGSKETRDYYFSIHGRNGYDDAGADFISYINPGYTGNAYWTGSGTSFGGSSTGTDPYVTLDVSGHEHTHGMIDFTSNLTYSYESGALNESFADCIGEAVEAYALGTPDWIHRFEINSGNRSFINPNAKGDPDTYLGTNWWTTAGDAGGVHTNSGVQNFWFYNLSEGGSGTNDNGDTYSVSGIGINKARMIAFDCMVGLVSSSQYTNARAVSIQKAKDRYGNCANEVVQTTNAWRAVGVGTVYIAPLPLTITVSTSSVDVCTGGVITVTAFGATTYTWSNGWGSGNPKAITVNTTSTYTVTGTNAESCTGTKSFTLRANSLPTVEPTVTDNELCPGQSTSLSAGSNQTINSLLTEVGGINGASGNVFDVHAYNNITITDFKMDLELSTDSVEIYYNPGGYGNADVLTTTGWTKLGSTVAVNSAGPGNLTTIPTTVNLTIGAGSTYGILIACNGANNYSNGTLVGSIAASNSDLYITEGHGGSAFGGTFNMTFSPRVFNGTVEYRTNYASYSWAPAATLSSATSSVPVASPTATTNYTLTATDGNGCTNTGIAKVYLYANPLSGLTSASPSSICRGGTSQLSNIPFLTTSSQNLFTTLNSNNGNAAIMFDVHAINNITITNVRMNINTGDSAQVWYKTSPYGNANVNSSAGWTKLGNTVAITPAGSGALTLISTTSNLVIPAGSTYGLAVICNGSINYTNGTAVGAVAYSSPDMEITEGHGGTGFNGVFNFVNSPRVFNGQIDYTVTNHPMTYSWSPSSSLSSSTISNPVADPTSTTEYRMILTDAHGCKDTAFKKVYVNPNPQVQTTVAPVICPGDSAQITTTVDVIEKDSLLTTLETDNSMNGNAFDVVSTKAMTIRAFKMHLGLNSTQVEVWYKTGGYGNANFSGTTGWTKLGLTLTVVPAGPGLLTTITPTQQLVRTAGQVTGFMLVTNGTVYYLASASAVGSTYTSNPDMTITVGHGGTGIGAYNFAFAPRVFNGEIVYDVNNGPVTYSWTPNTNMNNAFIANPKASPLTNTLYTVTVNDANGCSGTGVAGVVVAPQPALGTATASPATICIGSTVNLTYTQPAAAGCYGGYQGNFAGAFAPATWTLNLVNSNGTVNTTSAPNSISMTSSNGLAGSGQTNYSHSITCNGLVSFDWSYSTTDGAQYDYPRYSVDGINFIVFPGYQGQLGDPKTQVGSLTISVTAGQTLTIQAYSSDNVGGSCSIFLSDFKAPYSTFAGQSVVWYNAATGGSSLGSGNPQSHQPLAPGSYTYYAQVTSAVTTCTNPTRVATNVVVVGGIPTVSTSATQTTICAGQSTTLSASGALTYTWMPGSLSGTSVVVSPATTTTYTVTGLTAAGCTATAVRTITVNTPPTVTTSATTSTINCSGSTTITANGAVSYTWMPGSLVGNPIIVSPISTTTYTVTGTAANGCTSTATLLITYVPCAGSVLNLKAFIEGYYIGGSTMNSVLANQGLPNPVNHADSLTVELHNAIAPYALVYTFKGVLLTNGNMTCTFPSGAIGNSYYIVLKHRNAIETWSSSPVLASGSYNYNFSNLASKAYGNNQVNMEPGVFALYSGDVTQDLAIDALDYVVLDPDVISGAFGYIATDLTGDGIVDAFDYIIIDPNIINGVGAVTP